MATSILSGERTSEDAGRLSTATRLLGWIALPLIGVALALTFWYAPTEATMGDVYRIFFFHVPSASASFLGFFVTFVASIGYLAKRRQHWDHWAVAGAEVGVTFSLVTIVTGSFWARPVWNTWWTWDPRLTTVTIMLLTYVAYLMLREAVDDPERRARFAAVMGILAFVNVPLVWFSARWFRTIHPVLVAGSNTEATEGDFAVTDPMRTTLMVAILAVFVLFGYLLLRRVRLEQRRARVAGRLVEYDEEAVWST